MTSQIPSLHDFQCCSGLWPGRVWSPSDPEELVPTDFVFDQERDELIIGIFFGGRYFNFISSGSLLPADVCIHLYTSLWTMTREETHLQLAKLFFINCREILSKFIRQKRSLMSFLYVWTIKIRPFQENLHCYRPTQGRRIGHGHFEGVDYKDEDLPWYSWDSVEVFGKSSDSDYQVLVDQKPFHCYIPSANWEIQGCNIFLEEVKAWKRISRSPEIINCNISALKGFVHSRSDPTKIQGVLYQWAKPHPVHPTLRWADLEKVSIFQRQKWLQQIRTACSTLHRLSASWTRTGCQVPSLQRVFITYEGNAHLRRIHFGRHSKHGSQWKFEPDYEADALAIAEVKEILELDQEIDLDTASPFRFLELPYDTREIIYKDLLVYPQDYVRWLWGFRHQHELTLSDNPIEGRGLFCTSRQVRQESITILIKNNRVVLDTVSLKSFLRTSLRNVASFPTPHRLPICQLIRRVTIMIPRPRGANACEGYVKAIKNLYRHCSSLHELEVAIFSNPTERPLSVEHPGLKDLLELPHIRMAIFRPPMAGRA